MIRNSRKWCAYAVGGSGGVGPERDGASAQDASISGSVTDSLGGVLPGTRVRAECGCLAVPREALAGGEGRYNLTALPNGTYTITFGLRGFSTFVAAEVVLTAGFAATINAEMVVGGVEETITVTAATPIVDVVNAAEQRGQQMDTLEALPTGARDLTALTKVTLGVVCGNANRQDVGGALAEINTGLSVHGSHGDQARMDYDGMNTNVMYSTGGGQQRIWKFNTLAVKETIVDAGGGGAKTATGGANLNMIPREGSNVSSGNSFFTYNPKRFGASAVPDSVKDRSRVGTPIDEVQFHKKVWDLGSGFGGAMATDRLWYYASAREWGGQSFSAGTKFNISPDFWRYEGDPNRALFTNLWQRDYGLRLTFQATPKNKIVTDTHWQMGCRCRLGASLGDPSSPEAVTESGYGTDRLGGGNGMLMQQFSWLSPVTNNLLLQGGVSLLFQTVWFSNEIRPERGDGAVRITDATSIVPVWGTQPLSNSGGSYERPHENNNFTFRGSASYVTGSHRLEVGYQGMAAQYDTKGYVSDLPPISYLFFSNLIAPGQVALQLTQHALPTESQVRVRTHSAYVNDQWTIDRMTITAGLRFDHLHSFALLVTLPGGQSFILGTGPTATEYPSFVNAVGSPGLEKIPMYNDISPRVGVSYELSGDGRTALRVSWGQYLMQLAGGDAQSNNPAHNRVVSVNRMWFDDASLMEAVAPFLGFAAGPTTGAEVTGDFVPQCDLSNSAANGECGPTNLPVSALRTPLATTPWEANTGWGVRGYSNNLSVGIQHELMESVGLSVSYYRNRWKNQQYTFNSALTAADFAVGTITAPEDSRLGDRNGAVIAGVIDRNADSLGRNEISRVAWEDIPGAGDGPSEVFQGVDIGINARNLISPGSLIQGGVTLGKRVNDTCWANDLPWVTGGTAQNPGGGKLDGTVRNSDYCDSSPDLWDSPASQVKFQWLYPLPADFAISGNFYTNPGIPYGAVWDVPAATAAAAFGRPATNCGVSTSCGGTLELDLIPDDTNHDDRITQLDLRLTRTFRFGEIVLDGAVELYNVFNSRPVLGQRDDFDAQYEYPLGVLGGRFFKWTAGLSW